MTLPNPDPHLQAALHHAPDEGSAPPPELSQAILRAAREAVQAPKAPSAPRGWHWLAALQQPRWAGSAAALMLSVVIGSLWWGQTETDPRPQERVMLPAPATVPMPAPADVASAAPQAPAAERPTALRKEVPRAVARPAAPQAKVERERREAATETMAKAEAPAPTPAPTPAPAAAPPLMAQDSAAPPPAPPSLARLQQAPARFSAAEGTVALRSGAPASTRRTLAAEQAAASAPTLRTWLLQLREASAGRWRPQAAGAQPSGEARWRAAWREAGALQASVSLHGRTLWWQEADGTLWSAELEAAAAEALPEPPAGVSE